MLASARPSIDEDWLSGIEGELVRFSEIEQDNPWVNVETGKMLEPGDEPSLPENLKPNGTYFNYIFYPKGKGINHKLFYISKSRNQQGSYDTLSPRYVRDMFQKLFDNNEEIKLDLQSLEVTVLPDRGALKSIFKIHSLKKIELLIKAPNPDDLADEEHEMWERMDIMNVSKIYQEYISEKNESIKPDEELKIKAKIAASNGYVKGIGKTADGVKEEISTTEVPLKEEVVVENNNVAEIEALRAYNNTLRSE